MRRRGFAALSFGVAATSLTGCAGSPRDISSPAPPPPRAVGELTIWAPDPMQGALAAAGRRFARAHRGVSVRVEARSTDAIAEALRANGEESIADLVWIPHQLLGALANEQTLAPLEVGSLARALNPLAVGAFTRAGQIFAMPCCLSNLAVVRNSALTRSTPTTWTDAVGTRTPVDRPGPVLQGLGGRDGDAYGMFGWQTSFGNTAFALTDDGTLGPDLTLNDDAGQSFATWLFAQGRAGLKNLDATLTDDQAARLFRRGECPYLVAGEGQARALQAAGMDLAVLPFPSAGGQEPRPFLRVEGLGVLNASPIQDAAAAFVVEQIATVPAQVALARAGGQSPALADAMKDPRIEHDAITMGFVHAGSNGIPAPALPQMSKIWQLWGSAETQIIGGAPPEKTWSAMCAAVNRLVGA